MLTDDKNTDTLENSSEKTADTEEIEPADATIAESTANIEPTDANPAAELLHETEVRSAEEAENASKPKILIMHASVGSGHKSAAQAIAKALELVEPFDELGDFNIEVLDVLDFGRIIFDGDATASMFTGATRPFYDLTWRFTFTGRLLWGGGTIFSRIMFPKFTEYVRQNNIAAIICTHITAANVAVGARLITGEMFPIVCVPTDYEVEGLWPHRYTDLFCVANEFMAETLRARKVPERRILVTGLPVSPAFSKSYDKDECKHKLDLPEDKRVALFLAGASLPRPYVHFRTALRAILPYLGTLEDMYFVIVCGRDAEFKAEMDSSIADLGLKNVIALGFVTDMAELMAASDLVVCKSGGLTVTECLCIAAPMLLVGKAYGQEKANVSMVTARGCAFHATTSRELLRLLREIDTFPQLTEAIRTNEKLIRRPNAAVEIAQATMGLIEDYSNADGMDLVLSPLNRKRFMRFAWGNSPAHIR